MEPKEYERTTPRPLYPWERPGTHCTGGCVGLRAGLDECENLAPTGIRSPERPARKQSLYRLSYPAHIYIYIYIYSNNGRHPVTKNFTTLHPTTLHHTFRHFTSCHINFTKLLSFKLHPRWRHSLVSKRRH
jgi:hypothetical protein